MRAVSIGECMVELRQQGLLYARGFAGDTYNAAVYLKRAFPELQVQFLTATGDDSMSTAMRAAWCEEGIDGGLAYAIAGGPPGLYLIELDANGERQFLYWRSASAARQWFALLERDRESAALAHADLVYFSGISLAILDAAEQERAVAALGKLKGQAGLLAFDPNFRAALWPDVEHAQHILNLAMRAADIVLPSTEDVAAITGIADPSAQMTALLATGISEIAMTLGSDGCMVASDGTVTRIPAPATQVVDTSGAGDAFNGAYLAERLRGRPPAEAARAGLAMAASVVAYPGAIIPHAKDTP